MGPNPASAPRLVPLGDRALLIEFESRISDSINRRAIALADRLDQSRLTGVRFVAPAFCSVSVGWDPQFTTQDQIIDWVQATLANAPGVQSASPPSTSVLEIPVCYEMPCAPDLEDVARLTGLTPEEIIRHHTQQTYRVYMLGFLPGFAYLGTLPAALVVSRRASPRPEVPAGSVGLAGAQTGVYPVAAPGGWQIIGRTPSVPFPRTTLPGFGLRAGDSVRFRSISLDEFQRLHEDRS